MKQRFGQFGLELHPEKTRLVEFGRFAAARRRVRGLGKPVTFNFLGFTHICAKTRNGQFTVLRKTMRKRLQAKLSEVRTELQRRLHDPVPEVGAYLRSVVLGHTQYYGVPRNGPALVRFREAIVHAWRWVLRRRSQRRSFSWTRMAGYARRWLPRPRICHPYPNQRFAVTTQGGSRMR